MMKFLSAFYLLLLCVIGLVITVGNGESFLAALCGAGAVAGLYTTIDAIDTR